MFMTIKCQSCGKDTQFSLNSADYEGPFTCWKCHVFAQVKIKDCDLVSWKTLTAEEAKVVQEKEAARRKE